jgi:hypothetical protein
LHFFFGKIFGERSCAMPNPSTSKRPEETFHSSGTPSEQETKESLSGQKSPSRLGVVPDKEDSEESVGDEDSDRGDVSNLGPSDPNQRSDRAEVEGPSQTNDDYSGDEVLREGFRGEPDRPSRH